MFEFTDSVFIQRPPQEVFDVITDPATSVKWQSSLDSAAWISEAPYGVGSSWTTKIKFLGRDIEAVLEVTEWESPRLVSFKSASGPVPMKATNKLEPQDDGTLLTITGQVELGGFFKVAEGMAGKQTLKQIQNDNQKLKQMMESRQL